MSVLASSPVMQHVSRLPTPQPRNKFVIGICALDKKARSKPMRNIIDRLLMFNEFEAVIFGDKVILDEPVDSWPNCDFLISFFSKGFPLLKAIEYVKLRRPFCVNDLPLQQLLLDRRLVYMVLDAIDVPTPTRYTVSRDRGPSLSKSMSSRLARDFGLDLATNLVQYHEAHLCLSDPDLLVIDGCHMLRKPFVEKPVNSEDHNIYIYYPGGGIRKLFRKIGNKSSEYFPDEWMIRTEGSFVYEAFMNVDNSEDVKVYTIGPNCFYAESRKSPVVDGIVCRNVEGKELRKVTPLSDEEQDLARRVCMAFGQTVCGFDLLRASGVHFVIDVNGWSFVKGNDPYYDLCAKILRETFLRISRKRKMRTNHSTTLPFIENQWYLKKYIGIFRHADRTPKQKLKFSLNGQVALDAFSPFLYNQNQNGHGESFSNLKISSSSTTELISSFPDEVLVRHPDTLQAISQANLQLIEKLSQSNELSVDNTFPDDISRLIQLRDVLDRKLRHADTKLQLRPIFDFSQQALIKLQIIVKWGGEFTHAGRHHTKELGENLRQELHLTNKELLDDIKVYSSSERRVLATSEVFLKALLGIAELPLDYIKVSKAMLDDNMLAKEQMDNVKQQLKTHMMESFLPDSDRLDIPLPMAAGLEKQLDCPGAMLKDLVARASTLRDLLFENEELQDDAVSTGTTILSSMDEGHLSLIGSVSSTDSVLLSDTTSINYLTHGLGSSLIFPQHKWCCFDSTALWKERWHKLFDELLGKPPSIPISSPIASDSNSVELSKVCELYDSLKYDAIHNRDYLLKMFTKQGEDHESSMENLKEFFLLTKQLHDYIGPQEYGITVSQKLCIGSAILHELLLHLLKDLSEAKLNYYGPACRFYFTKESHIYPMLNIVLYAIIGEEKASLLRFDCQELDYLSQISLEVYERRRQLSGTNSPLIPICANLPSLNNSANDIDQIHCNCPLHGVNGLGVMSPSVNIPTELAIRIGLSPGAHASSILDLQMTESAANKHAISVQPRQWITDYIPLDTILLKLEQLIASN